MPDYFDYDSDVVVRAKPLDEPVFVDISLCTNNFFLVANDSEVE